MGITREYFTIQKHFEKKYGPNTCVIVAIGKFYEIYEYDPVYDGECIDYETEGNVTLRFSINCKEYKHGDEITLSKNIDKTERIGHAVDIGMILRMRLTSKNKGKQHSMDNPMLVGFPCPSYETHRDTMLFHGYTIVRIDQKDKSADAENVEREVVEISSPGTEIDNTIIIQSTGSNKIVSIYIECQRWKKNMENNMILCGLSSMDVSTAENTVSEIYSKENDETYAINEIYRFLIAQKPVDVIIHVENIPHEHIDDYVNYLTETLELDRYPTSIIKCNQLEAEYRKDDYQENVLAKAFAYTPQSKLQILQPGSTNLIYQLDLERFTYGLISYCVLLQYCYEHNENIIKNLQKPSVGWTDERSHLILAHNAMLQLDIFPKNNIGHLPQRNKQAGFDSLISVLDLTSTAVGSRFLRRRLLNPSTDHVQLESLYAMTDELVKDERLLNKLDIMLKRMPDIERYQRKVQIGLIKPKELVTLFNGYLQLQEIYRVLHEECFGANGKVHLREVFISEKDVTDFNECLTEVWNIIDLDKLDKVKFTSRIGSKSQTLQCSDSFIHPGHDQEIDALQSALQQYRSYLVNIQDYLNSTLTGRVKKLDVVYDRVKIDDSETETGNLSVYLSGSAAAVKQLKTNSQMGELKFQEVNKTKTMITSDNIQCCCSFIELYQYTLEQRLLAKFYEVVNRIAQRTYFNAITQFIGTVDFVKTNAKLALKYKYYRPEINVQAPSPFVTITGLRHPLAERIIRTEYITNDLSLGAVDDCTAMLTYGVNSVGKTSLAKALACVLMMAQAGFYVPGQLVYKPFNKIITRLSGEDDLLRSKSSFVVEMTELRTILRNADSNTLVLGDELCRGTESLSGTSLTVRTIKTLIDVNAKFIFSTHMHHLPKIKLIKEYRKSNRLKIVHLSTTYNESLEKLIFNRKLQDGPGSAQYGLEVCKSLGIDREFIDSANEIRRELEEIPNLFHSKKKSKYSNRVYVDVCQFCGDNSNLQTHHIQKQRLADQNGHINHYHKNSSFNLIVLCRRCHEQLEDVNMSSQQTLEGVYLTSSS